MRFLSTAIAATSLFASAALADLDPIVIKGSKFFFKSNGTQFFMRGVAYQQGVGANGAESTSNTFVDPLTDSAACKRDVPKLQAIRTNTIRVYAIDTEKDHTDCFKLLQDAGIYVVADLGVPGKSIDRANPQWNDELYDRYTKVVDTLQKYSNVIGFIAGNEVANNLTYAGAIPFVKAAARDTKAYIKQKGYRTMAVGYAADDGGDIRNEVLNYVNCGDQTSAVDFYGYNIYSWCGSSATFTTSHYSERTTEFANFSIPSFFAEYGCIVDRPRLWNDAKALFSKPMSDVFSGGLVYEYFNEANDYGLVEVSGNSVTPNAEYTALSKVMATIAPTGVQMGSYNPTNSPRACPSSTKGGWAVATNLPPTPNKDLCSCMVKSLTCVPKDGVDTDDYEDLFNTACKQSGVCDGITANGTAGKYGAYSMCSDVEKLSFALNSYYSKHSSDSNACSFGGSATKQTASTPSSCSSLLSQAGADGTGTVSGGSSSSSTNAASGITVPSFDFGLLTMGVYVTFAAVAGAGMILM